MSSRSTIFLTQDNEHCYFEGSEYVGANGQSPIYFEIDKNNIDFEENEDTLVIIFDEPDSDIYKLVSGLNGGLKEIAIAYLKQCIKDEENIQEECIQELEDQEQADEHDENIKEYEKVLKLIKEKY